MDCLEGVVSWTSRVQCQAVVLSAVVVGGQSKQPEGVGTVVPAVWFYCEVGESLTISVNAISKESGKQRRVRNEKDEVGWSKEEISIGLSCVNVGRIKIRMTYLM